MQRTALPLGHAQAAKCEGREVWTRACDHCEAGVGPSTLHWEAGMPWPGRGFRFVTA